MGASRPNSKLYARVLHVILLKNIDMQQGLGYTSLLNCHNLHSPLTHGLHQSLSCYCFYFSLCPKYLNVWDGKLFTETDETARR